MATAKLTLIGLLNWNQNLFNDIVIPDGMDRTDLINEIIIRCADYEVMYPDVTFFKQVSDHFFKKHALTFSRWWEAINMEYEPLYNYDRYEDLHDVTDDTGTTGTNSTTTGQVSAYDATDFQNRDKATGTSTTNNELNHEHTANNHIYGNIGVTTSSKMLEEYIETQKINIYERIADMYLSEMCLPVE